MALLLTGGLGFIGTHVAASLHENEQKVVLLDHFCNGYANAAKAKLILRWQVKHSLFEMCDLLGSSQILSAVIDYIGVTMPLNPLLNSD
jgi:UDP-glucose 4-epimerase